MCRVKGPRNACVVLNAGSCNFCLMSESLLRPTPLFMSGFVRMFESCSPYVFLALFGRHVFLTGVRIFLSPIDEWSYSSGRLFLIRQSLADIVYTQKLYCVQSPKT